jgi:tetratricopeptide (TPR) repeat protein
MNQLEQILDVATQKHQAGQLNEAENLYRQVLNQNPNHPDALHLLGVIAFQVKRIDAATDLIQRAIQINPNVPDYHSNMGLIMVAQGRLDQAVACYQRALKVRPDDPKVLFNLANALLISSNTPNPSPRSARRLAPAPIFPKPIGIWPGPYCVWIRSPRARATSARLYSAYRISVQQQPNDAETLFELANALHSVGEYDEAIAAYERAIALKPDYHEAYNNLGNTLCLRGREGHAVIAYNRSLAIVPNAVQVINNLGNAYAVGGEYDKAITCFRRALQLAPDRPEFLTNMGNALRRKGEPDLAVNFFERSLALRPDVTHVMCNLADVLQKRGENDRAIEWCNKALQVDPKCVDAFNTIGAIHAAKGDLDAAMACFQKAMEIHPDQSSTLNNMGNVLHTQGRIQEAIDVYQRCLKEAPDYALVHWNLGLMYLMLGDFAKGWPESEWRFKVKQFGPRTSFNRACWDGSDLTGKRILLHAEQGFGDVLQFIRYVPPLARSGARISMAAHAELHRLLRGVGNKFGELGGYVENWVIPDGSLPEYDFHCPIMVLPRVLNTTLENIPTDIPYLWPEEELASHWRKRMKNKPGLKVGLAWAGRPSHPNDRHRSFPLAMLAPLAGVSGVTFFSLQKGAAAGQTAETPFEIVDWTGDLNDFADTAAMIANLDLVISADTAVVHLAGAMGKPVWVLLPFVPDWRWMLDREDTPWYPQMRLFRQKKIGDWDPVIARVVQALESHDHRRSN